jgi:hypothetical protein
VSNVPTARQPAPSLGPALIVVGIALVIVVFGAALALIGTASAHAPVTQVGSKVPGVAVEAVPASSYLSHIESSGEPPPDIVKQLTIPVASKYVSSASESAALSQFASSITFSSPDPSKQVAAFYSAELPIGHWSLQFNGKAGGNLELIAQKNGSDGYQWRVAVVISTVNPLISPALAGSNATSTSKVVMSLYQVEDES